jgi:hypothetical protein
MFCNKKCFNKKDAQSVINIKKRRHHKKNYSNKKMERRIYFCEECNAYHLTSQVLYAEMNKIQIKKSYYKRSKEKQSIKNNYE